MNLPVIKAIFYTGMLKEQQQRFRFYGIISATSDQAGHIYIP